uniref:Uncharacterized protein n=1 Tax=Eutreptiella gymnastica TaxID=73025 RepID=A0A7S4GK05_9EUGL
MGIFANVDAMSPEPSQESFAGGSCRSTALSMHGISVCPSSSLTLAVLAQGGVGRRPDEAQHVRTPGRVGFSVYDAQKKNLKMDKNHHLWGSYPAETISLQNLLELRGPKQAAAN